MRMWFWIFFILPFLGLAYAGWHIWRILPLSNAWRVAILVVLFAALGCLFVTFSGSIDRWPMPAARAVYEVGTSSIFVLLYVVMLFLLLDLLRLCRILPASWLNHSGPGSLAVLAIILAFFVGGYFHYMHKERIPAQIETNKTLDRPLTIVMASDLHIGYHNPRAELRRWVDLINKEHPDLILLAGDIIDRSVRPLIVENCAAEFRRLMAPVYACPGNHDGYAGLGNAQEFCRQAGIRLLCDETATVEGLNIIGRRDYHSGPRKTLAQLTRGLDRSRYTIVLDHEPYHLEESANQNIDLQLSGHTHDGQVWPISSIERLMYEDSYGWLTKGNTRYYVSSGIGIWGGKFRIGTRSEYLVLDLINAKK